MKATKRALLRGTPYDERALALARRLIPELPLWLNPPRSEKHWIMLWACIGQELAEAQPEFGWGRGRRPKSDAELSKDARRKRRQRERHAPPKMLWDLIRWDK